MAENKHYSFPGEEGKFRFASELSYWQPVDSLKWQPFYFKYFGAGAEDDKSLPYPMKIKRDDAVQDITVIKFSYIDKLSSDFYSLYNQYVAVALVELSTEEKVILPCF